MATELQRVQREISVAKTKYKLVEQQLQNAPDIALHKAPLWEKLSAVGSGLIALQQLEVLLQQQQAAAVVAVHIQHGRNKLPTISLPIEQGTVNLLTRLCPYSRLTHFSRVDPLTFEKVAVSDAVDKPAYVPLECFSVPVQPGQHVYTQATGRPWLLRVLDPEEPDQTFSTAAVRRLLVTVSVIYLAALGAEGVAEVKRSHRAWQEQRTAEQRAAVQDCQLWWWGPQS